MTAKRARLKRRQNYMHWVWTKAPQKIKLLFALQAKVIFLPYVKQEDNFYANKK